MTSTDLAALAERVEVATGPSRELDAEIHAAAHGRTITSLEIPSRDGLWARPGRYYYGSALMADAPELTGSIDAALTLLPEGWHVIIHARPDWPCVESVRVPAALP